MLQDDKMQWKKDKVGLGREEWVTILNRLNRVGLIEQRLPFHLLDLEDNNNNSLISVESQQNF